MAMRETMTQISNPLLNTKLFIPRSRPDLIPRVRLTGLLQAGAWVSNEIKTPQLVAPQHRDWRG